MVKAKVEIVGIKQLEDVLTKLPKDLEQRNVLRSAIRTAGKPLAQELKDNLIAANETMGSPNVDLSDQILVKALSKRKTWRAGYMYGWDVKKAMTGFKKYLPDISRAKWALLAAKWLEWGSAGIGRYGKYRGKSYRAIRPQGWFRRAIDSQTPKVENSFRGILYKTLNRYIDRYIKKGGIWSGLQ